MRFLQILILIFLPAFTGMAQNAAVYNGEILIPKPKEIISKAGNFSFNKRTVFIVENDEQQQCTEILNSLFKSAAGWKMEVYRGKPLENSIQLKEDMALAAEAYKLSVSSDRILLKASSRAGFVFGLETIRQLLPPEIERKQITKNTDWKISNLAITDSPRFRWRGVMLDVVRHFFPKEYILKTIDRLAFLKMNTLHLHLVDDQGWRIEIKKYPKLTEVGAFRVDQEEKPWNSRPAGAKNEKPEYGGFYTQQDIKEIVAYAQERGITVVPEIEMPAHVMSAIAAYPWLSCKEEPISVPSGGVWPITEIYCPGKERTFQFLEDVLTEVMELFPSKYIHVGGDEATKTNWESCTDCQRRIKEEGLAGTDELQSYFMKRIEKFLNENGRTLIGWDEILEGGLPEEATVMSWRGIKGGWEASKEGHDVVMTPGDYMYFDHYQGNSNSEPLAFGGYTPLKKVYQFDPVTDSMSVAQKRHVLGGQANLWSEYISTEEHSEYMLFPRLLALSEVLWSPEGKTGWSDFSARVQKMFDRLDLMGINYATSAYQVTPQTEVDLQQKKLILKLRTEFPNSVIKYTLDGKRPDANSNTYKEPLELNHSVTLKASVFEDGRAMGDTLVKKFRFHKAVAKNVQYEPKYDGRYTGAGKTTLVNVLRGSTNFHDGQWLGWLGEDVEITIDLGKPTEFHKVSLGSMENQGAGIYFPVGIAVSVSEFGKEFHKLDELHRDFSVNPIPELKDFEMKLPLEKARYIRLKIDTFRDLPRGGKAWLFLDEIQVE